MPDVLRVKRRAAGGAAGPPASLAAAEVAFNEQDNVLYYGKGNSGGLATSILPIAGPGGFLPLAGGTVTGNTTFGPSGVTISGATASVGLQITSSTTIGINLTGGTFTGPAIRLASQQALSFTATSVRNLYFDNSTTPAGLRYSIGSVATPNDVITLGDNGTITALGGLNADNAAGTSRGLGMYTAGLARWTFRANATAEGGSNAGSDLDIASYSDAGTGLVNPLVRITRSTGLAQFFRGIAFPVVAPGGVSDLSRHIALFSTTYGLNVTTARLNHVVPSGAAHGFVVAGADIATINAAGLTMGTATSITLAANPTAALHAVTKQYVDGIAVIALNARAYGALGNGVNDDTAELQAAIDAATAAQIALYIPAGRYLISAALNIQRAVRIFGAGTEPYVQQFSASPATGAYGTWILLDGTHLVSVFNIAPAGTASDYNEVFGVEISHIGILHNHTAPAPGWVPRVYPAAIKFGGVSQVHIHDMLLMNPYVGFEATGTNQGMITIERVRGQPLYAAMVMDRIRDVLRVRDCHWWVFWSLDAYVLTWQKTNGWVYRLGFMDNPIFDGNFCMWYRGGILADYTTGPCNKALFTNCMFDTVGTMFATYDTTGLHDLLFVNCVAYSDPTFQTSSGVYIAGSGNSVVLSFVNSAIMSYSRSCVELVSTGSGNKVRLTGGSLIQSWAQVDATMPALYCVGANSVIADSSCSFNSAVFGGGFVGPYPGGQVVREAMTVHQSFFIPAVNTATIVGHSLGTVPSGAMLTMRSSLGFANCIWIDTLTASTGTIRTDIAPGGDLTVDVMWVMDAEL